MSLLPMRRVTIAFILCLSVLALPDHRPSALRSQQSEKVAQEPDTPIGPPWWPSEWGKDDQRGAANRQTADKVLEARNLIQSGKVYQLGRLYEHGMPLPGKRHFSLTIPGSPTMPPSGKNQIVSFDEMFSG